MLEIERKFLVTSDNFKKESFKKLRISQGFLNTHKERTVRIRIKENKGFITVKGISSEDGLSRFEWEKEIPKNEAIELLGLCEKGVIDKTRYDIKVGSHIFEVDEFFGDNEGLVVAEVELKSTDEKFEKPDWLGQEVTGQAEYYNSQLSKEPFKTWKK
jgi:CYTH domain-containing protein